METPGEHLRNALQLLRELPFIGEPTFDAADTALATLRTAEEYRAFLRDLCTPAELQAMADRWTVVDCLERELPYREIHRLTGVSVTGFSGGLTR